MNFFLVIFFSFSIKNMAKSNHEPCIVNQIMNRYMPVIIFAPPPHAPALSPSLHHQTQLKHHPPLLQDCLHPASHHPEIY